MATTSKGIIYPLSSDQITPLQTHFANLASSTDSALSLLNASTDITAGTLPITRGGTGGSTQATALAALGAMPASASVAGKNLLLNGDFGIWQRGAAVFTNPINGAYTADRWLVQWDGTGATRTVQPILFSPGVAPITGSGYESKYYLRYQISAVGTGNANNIFMQKTEDVRTLANQVATFSFWARADVSRVITFGVEQGFGTGGSAQVNTPFSTQWYKDGVAVGTSTSASVTIGTTMARYSATITIPSVLGKTITTTSPTDSYMAIRWSFPANVTQIFDIWGVQLENGPVLTNFDLNGANPQAALAACQRFYYRTTPGGVNTAYGNGITTATTGAGILIRLPVTMRKTPSAIEWSGTSANYALWSGTAYTAMSGTPSLTTQSSPDAAAVSISVAGGLVANQSTILTNNATVAGYLGFSAEL